MNGKILAEACAVVGCYFIYLFFVRWWYFFLLWEHLWCIHSQVFGRMTLLLEPLAPFNCWSLGTKPPASLICHERHAHMPHMSVYFYFFLQSRKQSGMTSRGLTVPGQHALRRFHKRFLVLRSLRHDFHVRGKQVQYFSVKTAYARWQCMLKVDLKIGAETRNSELCELCKKKQQKYFFSMSWPKERKKEKLACTHFLLHSNDLKVIVMKCQGWWTSALTGQFEMKLFDISTQIIRHVRIAECSEFRFSFHDIEKLSLDSKLPLAAK